MFKKLLVGLMVLGLFTSCSDKEEKKVEVVDKKVEMKTEVKTAPMVEKKAEVKSVEVMLKKDEVKTEVKEKTVEIKTKVKVIPKKVTKNDSVSLFKACASCHGAKGDKKALGQSELIGSWSADKVEAALVGYKDGTYGKAMKGLMKAQAVRLSDAQIKSISKYISTLNK